MAKRRRAQIPVKLEAAGDTDIGRRSHNEDAILLRPDLNLFVVADGAGGQNAGNVASSIATTTVAHFFEQTQPGAEKLADLDPLGLPTAARRLSAAVHEANKEIMALAEGSDRHQGMGTTVVAALFGLDRRWVHIAQVGDSRCYRLRDGRLELLTRDHCIATDVLELRPDIDDAAIATLPKNVITRALGMQADMRVSMRTRSFAHGDRYLLCSDGLSDVVNNEQIADVLSLDSEVDELVRVLLDMALEGGATDNVAIILIDCALSGATAETSTRPLKKLTPGPMPRVAGPRGIRPRLDTITEENAPEIVLFRDGADRESAPLIHVVPLESGTQDVLDAVTGVMAPDSTSPPAMPTTARSDKPGEKAADEAAKAEPAKKHDSGRYAIIEGVPESGDGGEESRATEPGEEPRLTRAMVPPRMERGGGAAKKPLGQTYSAPRRNRPSPSLTGTPARTGDTAAPPSPKIDFEVRGAATATDKQDEPKPEEPIEDRVATPPPMRSKQPTDAGPKPKLKPRLNLPSQARKRKSRPKSPAVHERQPIKKRTTKPRIVDQAAPPEDDKPREAPAEALPDPPKKGGTIDGFAPSPFHDRPEAREPLDTNEFVGGDHIPCHACGSVISRLADRCMYCGAETGFVKED